MASQVAVIGSPSCGKTSIILSCAGSEVLGDFIPPKLPPTAIQTEKSTLVFHDTRLAEEREYSILKSVNVVLLVVDATSDDSLEDIYAYWIPLFVENEIQCPIILVLNKMDLLKTQRRKQVQKPYSKKHIRDTIFEKCVPVSSQHPDSIGSLTYAIEETIKDNNDFPRAPLYDFYQRHITDKFSFALRRCFRILDESHNGVLDYKDFSKFSLEVIHEELSQDAFKSIISRAQTDSFDNVRDCGFGAGLTESGFLYCMQLYARSRNFAACWNLLRICEYGPDLELEESSFPKIKTNIHSDQIYQFSREAYELLTIVFQKFGTSVHDTLVVSFENLRQLLSVIPRHLPCGLNIESTMREFECEPQGLTLDGWLSFWSLCLIKNPELTIKQLVYLDSTSCPIEDRNDWVFLSGRKIDDRNATSCDRTVYQGLVFGPAQCGKTWFCNQLPCRESEMELTTSLQYYINRIYREEDNELTYKFLTLIEVPTIDELTIEAFDELLPTVDFVIFLFDVTNPRSLSNMLEIVQAMPKEHSLPMTVYACKTDCRPMQQFDSLSDKPLDVDKEIKKYGFTQENAYDSYVEVGEEMDPGRFDQLFIEMFTVAAEFPEMARLKQPEGIFSTIKNSLTSKVALTVAGVGTLALVALTVNRMQNR